MKAGENITVASLNIMVTDGSRERSDGVCVLLCIMVSSSNITKVQKEQYVKELYKQDKTIREIIQRARGRGIKIGHRQVGLLF